MSGDAKTDFERVPRAAVSYFGLVFATGFLLGAIRVPLLVPRLGVRYAELLEMPIMLAAIVWAARLVVSHFALPASPRIRLATGCIALALMIAAELVLVRLLQGQAAGNSITDRDPVSGGAYLGMLGLFALMPLIVLRRSNA